VLSGAVCPAADQRDRYCQRPDDGIREDRSDRTNAARGADSNGVVYVFWDGCDKKTGSLAIFYIRSFDGGKSFERPARMLTTVASPGRGGTMDGSQERVTA
jgi:hypothetical protein